MWHDFGSDGPLKEKGPDRQNGAFSLLLPREKTKDQAGQQGGTVIALRSRLLGDTTIPPELGEALLNTFIRTTAGSPRLPRALLLYGSAVLLAAGNSGLVEVLQGMEKSGCEILCCRTSVAALLPGEELAAGRLADWLELSEQMQKADKVLWP